MIRTYQVYYQKAFLAANQSKLARPVMVAVGAFLIGFLAGIAWNPVRETSAVAVEEPAGSAVLYNELSKKPKLEKIDAPELYGETDAENASSAWRAAGVNIGGAGGAAGAMAGTAVQVNQAAFNLQIPSIGLYRNAEATYVDAYNEIYVPPSEVGALTSYRGTAFANKTVLVGHRAGVFATLPNVRAGQVIIYQGVSYTIDAISQQPKNSVNMAEIISDSFSARKLILITCAGVNDSERLIVRASAAL